MRMTIHHVGHEGTQRSQKSVKRELLRLLLIVPVVVLVWSIPARAAGPDLRLVTAAADQDKPAIARLIKAGVDVNAARVDGVTPLLWAVHWDDLESADLL